MRSKTLRRFVICALLTSAWVVGAVAQSPVQIERYEALVERSEQLAERKGTIEGEMGELIIKIEGGDNSTATRGHYLKLELELLSLRGEIATVRDSVALLNLSIKPEDRVESTTSSSESSNAGKFSKDERFIKALSERDMQNLKRSESLERSVALMINEYISVINKIAQVRDNYNVATSQSVGFALKSEYDSLFNIANDLAQEIEEDWSYIYDNKSYSYDLILEINSKSDVSQEVCALRDSTLRKSREWVTEPRITTLKDYILQKSELLKVELMSSKALNVNKLADSLTMVSQAFSKMSRNYPSVELTARTFIDYKDAEILKNQIYTTANPIPQTKVYEKGVIYRIRVGSFTKKQPVATFRLSSEVSYFVETNGWYTYYIGGYMTYIEALEAQKMLKAVGFRRPEVVVWSDGVPRNLASNPYSQGDSYRLELTGRETLSAALHEEIMGVAKGATISKIGATTYSISPIQGEGSALQLSQIIAAHGSDILIEIRKL